MWNVTHKPSRRDVLKSASQYIVSFSLGIFLIPLGRFLNRLPVRPSVLRINKKDAGEGLTVLPTVFVLKSGEEVEVLSRRCPHLGCTVQRNADGGELVCPCHGSRLTLKGRYISGPAKQNLKPLSLVSRSETEWEVRL